jgi:hypothetical protein
MKDFIKEASVRPEVAKHLALLLATVRTKLDGSLNPQAVRSTIEQARRMKDKPKKGKEDER